MVRLFVEPTATMHNDAISTYPSASPRADERELSRVGRTWRAVRSCSPCRGTGCREEAPGPQRGRPRLSRGSRWSRCVWHSPHRVPALQSRHRSRTRRGPEHRSPRWCSPAVSPRSSCRSWSTLRRWSRLAPSHCRRRSHRWHCGMPEEWRRPTVVQMSATGSFITATSRRQTSNARTSGCSAS